MRRVLALLLAVQAFVIANVVNARLMSKAHLREKQAAAMKNFVSNGPVSSSSRPVKTNNITFSNPRAAGMAGCIEPMTILIACDFPEFFVDGTTIPEVDFDVGPSWAGLLPISNAANETREVADIFPLLRNAFCTCPGRGVN